MGVRQLSELRTDLKLTLDNRDDLSDTQLNYYINMAYNHVSQMEIRWHRELETVYDIALDAGVASYDVDETTVGFQICDIVDATFYDATSIATTTTRYDIQPREINWINKQTLSQYSGGPRHYCWWQDKIFLAYSPGTDDEDKIIRLTVYRDPADLSLDTDKTVLARYWDRAIVLGAKWMLELDLGYGEQAEASRQEYVAWINEKRNATESQSRDTRRRTTIRHEPYQ